MSSQQPLFVLRDDVTLDQVVTGLWQVTAHSRAIQSAMVELTSDKRSAADHFEKIYGLSTQVENNLTQIEELAEWLDSKKIEEVKS